MDVADRLTDSRNREEADASLRNFEELGKQLEEERVRVVDLQAAVSHKEEEIIDMLRAKEEAEQQVESLFITSSCLLFIFTTDVVIYASVVPESHCWRRRPLPLNSPSLNKTGMRE